MDRKELVVILNEDGFELVFEPTKTRYTKDEILFWKRIEELYQENPILVLLELGFIKDKLRSSVSCSYVIYLVKEFISRLQTTPELNERKEPFDLGIDEYDYEVMVLQAPYLINEQYLSVDFIKRFFKRLMEQFFIEVNKYPGDIESYMVEKMNVQPIGRVFFHLVENENDCGPFAFLATYSKLENGKTKQIPLENSLEEYRQDNDTLLKLLATIDNVAKVDVLVAQFINSGEIFHPLGLSVAEAYRFLQEIPIYEEAGITCRIPKWFKNKQSQIKMKVLMKDNNKVKFGYDEILDFDINFSLDGQEITLAEIQKLIEENEGLIFLKGKWVEVNKKQLNNILEKYEMIKQELEHGVSVKDALKMQVEDIDDDLIEYDNEEWLSKVKADLSNNQVGRIEHHGLNATLRPYQEQGAHWLNTMMSYNFGACLADDMGLGKTIQVLALLNNLKGQKSLLVVPATLLNNWRLEIEKFVPSLKFYIMHPSFHSNKEIKELVIDDYDVIITTYKLSAKYEVIQNKIWDLIILDEAQAIKNPGAKQTKGIKQLQAKNRIALTGTPIENKLLDLWSLFDFLNPGLLGTIKEFKDYLGKLEQSKEGYSRLKQLTSLFILRRLKTDKQIITDLPDKIEMKEYAGLSKQQLALYKQLVDELQYKLMNSEGIQRKGLVLASLLKCKQICNHPDLYLGVDTYKESDSGKFGRLKELCQDIYEKKEQVLVFTQFKEMVEPLARFLETIFNQEGLMLHGSLSVKKRNEMVKQFQSNRYIPFMVLSIKAGGVGLNLTKANHVIHFDRWWNPAVENQATDRAFRIGQKKNVLVHKFVCVNTIEEKIDKLLEEKNKLSDEVIGTKETWISELSNDELMDLFSLK